MKHILYEKFKESFKSVLPLTVVVTLVLLFLDVSNNTIFTFLLGAVMLIVGLAIFSIGAESSMMNLAKEVGSFIVRKRNLTFFITISFLLGFLITIAEPSVMVLGKQFESTVPLYTMIVVIALGSGIFAVISLLRIVLKIPLNYLTIIIYGLLIVFAYFLPEGFVPVSFDAGGFSTGPMAVPFLLALGFGITSTQVDTTNEDSFGLLGITSVGPVFAVLLLGLIYKNPSFTQDTAVSVKFLEILLDNIKNVSIAIIPFVVFFIVFQIFAFKYPKVQVKSIFIGFLLTYIGLVIFLSGASLGFMKIGPFLGNRIASFDKGFYIIFFASLFAMVIVIAEPSVIVLVNQVEKATDGAISKKIMLPTLVLGVTTIIALATTRMVYSINILWFITPIYLLVIILLFFTPKMFTGIALDSGAAVSGALASTFLVPFIIGAGTYLYQGYPNAGYLILQNVFGVMAFLVMAPLLTIQILGLIYKYKSKVRKVPKVKEEFIELDEG